MNRKQRTESRTEQEQKSLHSGPIIYGSGKNLLNTSTDATEVALPKENTIWKGDFSRLNTSIDATEVALPTAQTKLMNRGQRAENRRQKTEDRKQRAEQSNSKPNSTALALLSAFCPLTSAQHQQI